MPDLKIYPYILVMALITYLIRCVPFVLLRKKIRSRFIQSLLYYLPYAVLTAMTLPDVFSATGSFPTALAGFAVAVILSLMKRSLLTVAVCACLGAYLCGLIMHYI